MPNEICANGDQLLDDVVKNGAFVPNLWSLEVANSLLMAVKRKRITHELRRDILDSLNLPNFARFSSGFKCGTCHNLNDLLSRFNKYGVSKSEAISHLSHIQRFQPR